jgi:hypothetical protein
MFTSAIKQLVLNIQVSSDKFVLNLKTMAAKTKITNGIKNKSNFTAIFAFKISVHNSFELK